MMYDPNNQMSIYTMTNTLYRSDNFGSTWTTIAENIFDSDIQNAAITENNSNIIAVSNYNQLKISNDGGINFTEVSQTYLINTLDITFDPNNDNTIVTYGSYSNNNNKIFITNNLGQS